MKRNYLLFTVFVSTLFTMQAAAITFDEMPPVEKRVMPSGKNEILSFNRAVAKAEDSIVYISTEQTKTQEYIEQMNPLLEQFFGRQYHPHRNLHRQSLGSGVIISKDGYIVTNNHVVEDADRIMVKLPGSEREYKAELIGTDPKSDIAVIRIKADNLTPIKMSRSSDVKIGDIVFAIGNPFGVGLSVSQGIISAQHKDGIGINEYENFIQTDASINPGNSGGALIDTRGALVGINSAIITRSGGNNGIGFAIDVDMVKNIAKKLIENGSVERGYLGVNIGNLSKELKKFYTHKKGALLIDIVKDSPAELSGLKRGDLIYRIDGKDIHDAAELKNTIGMYAPGTRIKIKLERDGKDETYLVKLSDLGDNDRTNSGTLFKGVSLRNLDDQYRYRLRIPQEVEGVLVTEVETDSDAAKQGVRPGDVIVQIENKPVSSVSELSKAIRKAPKGLKRVYAYRDGHVFVVALN